MTATKEVERGEVSEGEKEMGMRGGEKTDIYS